MHGVGDDRCHELVDDCGGRRAGRPTRRPLDLYLAAYATFADKIRETEQFNDPEQWRFDWEQSYTRDQWLDLLPTTGGLTQLRPDQLAEILNAVGSAIDALGGRFTMKYTTLAATAVRAGAEAPSAPGGSRTS
ncbi:hypothetical protein [Microtetraspora malaysiensis]|uniref:hypothetical protein n=1 Tax=Microtetraspora malaysiensis TaxID=161358 RepID=UPI003D8EA1A9